VSAFQHSPPSLLTDLALLIQASLTFREEHATFFFLTMNESLLQPQNVTQRLT